MARRLRAFELGVLGGVGTALLLLGLAALLGGIAAAMGVVAFDSVVSPVRAAAVAAGGAVSGGIVGAFAPGIRSPGGAALLGAVAAIAANAVIRALDVGADGWPTPPFEIGEFILLLMPGVVGLGAPLLWAPVRIAATRSTGRAAAEIAVRVGAFVTALYAALICAPLVLAAGLGLIAGLRMLPRIDGVLSGLGYAGAALALAATSVICLWLAKVPRRGGTLPGFERPPDAH